MTLVDRLRSKAKTDTGPLCEDAAFQIESLLTQLAESKGHQVDIVLVIKWAEDLCESVQNITDAELKAGRDYAVIPAVLVHELQRAIARVQ